MWWEEKYRDARLPTYDKVVSGTCTERRTIEDLIRVGIQHIYWRRDMHGFSIGFSGGGQSSDDSESWLVAAVSFLSERSLDRAQSLEGPSDTPIETDTSHASAITTITTITK